MYVTISKTIKQAVRSENIDGDISAALFFRIGIFINLLPLIKSSLNSSWGKFLAQSRR